MLYLGIGFAVVLSLLFLGGSFLAADAAKLARFLRWFLVILASGLAIFLVFRGQALLAAAPAAVAAIGWRFLRFVPIGLWFRLFQMGKAFSRSKRYRTTNPKTASQGSSTVESVWVQMKLDHMSGGLNGVVIKGEFVGRDLDSLELEELEGLLREVRDDGETVQLLQSYLQRRFGDDWTEMASGGDSSKKEENIMSRGEAYDILGLPEGAYERAIRLAHRKLMASNHPDRGGSSYIATKINQARDVLLKS